MGVHMKLSKPAPGPDRWNKDDHLEHLHVFLGGLTVENVDTSRGPADAAHVDVIACVDCRQAWTDQLVFGKALVPRLTGDPDAEAIVGRFSQGLAKPGQSAPWVITDPTDSEMATGDAFVAKYVTTLPSGTVVVDAKALDADRGQDGQF
jgi:hypothetical protein